MYLLPQTTIDILINKEEASFGKEVDKKENTTWSNGNPYAKAKKRWAGDQRY